MYVTHTLDYVNFMESWEHTKYMLATGHLLKLPSLFAAWPFWTVHSKSHNMKDMVILSHSWSLFRPITCLYGHNELLWVSVRPCGVFSWEKSTIRLSIQFRRPWLPVSIFSHGLITVRKCKHNVVRLVFLDISLSTCHRVHMALSI